MPAVPVPEPPLRSGGVVLRPLRPDDVDAIVAACQDPEIPRWTQVPQPYTRDDAAGWIATHDAVRAAGEEAPFAIVDPDSDALLGSAGYTRFDWDHAVGEIGYWVAAWGRRRGAATAATRELAAWGFAVLGLERVEVWVHPDNAASLRVAARAGFTREGLLRSVRRHRRTSERQDYVLWSLLPADG